MKIATIIVTFNRLGDLKKTLEAYEQQTLPISSLIVVDNHSSDGTDSFLQGWEKEEGAFKRIVHILPENRGGSGSSREVAWFHGSAGLSGGRTIYYALRFADDGRIIGHCRKRNRNWRTKSGILCFCRPDYCRQFPYYYRCSGYGWNRWTSRRIPAR